MPLPLPTPCTIFFFANHLCAVFDHDGRQIPRYQAGYHGLTIQQLRADGINPWDIPNREGHPLPGVPDWWDDAHQGAYTNYIAALDASADPSGMGIK
jgi:hypothetical protein